MQIEGLPLKSDNLINYRFLRDDGVEIRGPMTRYYHWYSRHDKPMVHQILTADYVCRYRRGFILNGIGTGKTLIIYWLADYLKQEKEITKSLIIAPLSTLDDVHGDALRDHFPQLSFNILHGSKKKRLKLLDEDKDIYIINFDGVKVIEDALAARFDIDAIFIDEIAILRNSRTKRWKLFEKLFGVKSEKMCWGLTGSPMPKDPTDCYGQIRLVAPGSLPTKTLWRGTVIRPISFYEFRDQVMVPGWGKYEWKKRQGWQDFIQKTMQPSIRFERDDCCDLPECVTEPRKPQLSKEQTDAYEKMKKELKADLDNGEQITALNEGDKIRKLTQIACGGVYDEAGATTYLDYKPKFDELCTIIDDCKPSHVLIFMPFKNMPAKISADLNKHYCTEHDLINDNLVSGSITGDTKVKERSEYYKQFTAGSLRFIAATPHCMSHGLNLQHKCWVIVWWTPVEDFEKYEQANGRITRPGQKKKQIIFHMQSTPVEKAMYAKLKDKENAQGILLDLLKEG